MRRICTVLYAIGETTKPVPKASILYLVIFEKSKNNDVNTCFAALFFCGQTVLSASLNLKVEDCGGVIRAAEGVEVKYKSKLI